MARVRSVISASSRVSSTLSVSGRTSAKTGRAPAEDERVQRGGEGERRRDHLVSRADVEEQSGHLERVRARRREERLRYAEDLLQDVLAAQREGAVARQPRALDRFAHVVELAARNGRTMEGDPWRRGDGHGREPTRRSEPPTGHDTPMRISARSRSMTRSHARSSGRGKASSQCTSAVRRLYRDANMAGTRSETNEDTRVMRKPAPATLSISSRRA